MSDGAIYTFTGRRFFPLNPNPRHIDPIDIAHALSNQCRYTGHTKRFYSVATHSVLIHDFLSAEGYEPEINLWGLLHDASEAYLLDLAAPVKHYADGFGERFLQLERRIEEAVADRFNLTMPIPDEVKAADMRIRENEKAELMPPGDWEPFGDPLPLTIPNWTPLEAKLEMLWRMERYDLVYRDSLGNFTESNYLLV